jgi:hypothetical protein
MKNQLGRIFSGIASHRDDDEGKKKTYCQIFVLKMVLGSQMGFLGRKWCGNSENPADGEVRPYNGHVQVVRGVKYNYNYNYNYLLYKDTSCDTKHSGVWVEWSWFF